MAQQADQQENVKHDFKLAAQLDNQIVTIECSDDAQNKRYKVVYTKTDYNDIDNEFDKMKKAIEGGNAEICAPNYNGGPLSFVFYLFVLLLIHFNLNICAYIQR